MGQHAHLYRTAQWLRMRKVQLAKEPLCRMCAQMGRAVAATVADHVVPHRGDAALFYGELQSLCATCHSSVKQAEEASGVVKGCGLDGTPLDASHHWAGE